MVPQSWQREKFNRLKIKIFSYWPYLQSKNYWHYIKVINANNLYFINMANKKNF